MTRQYASRRLAPIARYIADDRFWSEQTEQLNVLPDGTLELVPRVGDHIVCLGAPVGIKHKLDRLMKFYKYGLSQAGWGRYERISVEFDNQIICKKKKSRS
jgi:cell division protein FtsQ